MTLSTREDAAARLASLRAQIDQAMHERVTPAMASAATTAESAMRDAAETLSGRVRARPLIALAAAACVGFVVGRVLRR
jgi:ElaB/YqjD/DUF883 family membrane-anchored ribosome-binding protein